MRNHSLARDTFTTHSKRVKWARIEPMNQERPETKMGFSCSSMDPKSSPPSIARGGNKILRSIGNCLDVKPMGGNNFPRASAHAYPISLKCPTNASFFWQLNCISTCYHEKSTCSSLLLDPFHRRLNLGYDDSDKGGSGWKSGRQKSVLAGNGHYDY